MAVYAAMVDRMDRNIGRVIDDLRKNGQLDNTLVLFLSDNGACAEWDPFGFDGSSGPKNVLHRGADLDKMGGPGTYHSYGSGWANACNTPFRLYKHYCHEGGIRTPLIAHWPKGIAAKGELRDQVGHLIDVMATCVDVTGATYPAGKTPPGGQEPACPRSPASRWSASTWPGSTRGTGRSGRASGSWWPGTTGRGSCTTSTPTGRS